MGRPGFTIINQQHPKLTGPFGDRPRSDLKSHPKWISWVGQDSSVLDQVLRILLPSSYSFALLDQLALRTARLLLLAALFTRAILNPARVARFPPVSHNFHLLTIFPTLPHFCAPRNIHPLLNAKPSARSIAQRSSSTDAISPLCDILPLRPCALSVDCAGEWNSTSQKYIVSNGSLETDVKESFNSLL